MRNTKKAVPGRIKSLIYDERNGLLYDLIGDYDIPVFPLSSEKLKAADQMVWVEAMNRIRDRAEDVVLTELIYRYAMSQISCL